MEAPARKIIRVALLGADSDSLPLARAIIDSRSFELAGGCDLETAVDSRVSRSVNALLGRGRQFDHWEALLDQQIVDAVIVARGADEDLRAEQLRKLIQAGVPLIVSHPVVDSMLVYYELEMIRRETLSVVVPYLPARHHPALRQVLDLASQGAVSPIGKIEQVVVGRGIAEPSKAIVLSQFARDADLIRCIAGDMTRLGAMAGSDGSSSYASLGVQMSGPSGIAARWSIDPTQTAHRAQLAVLGAGGKAIVRVASDGKPWAMDLTVDGKTNTQTYPGWNPAAAVLDMLQSALTGKAIEPDWVDAARSVELAETIDRSLKKSRTIELYYEDHTEEGTFKGTMTSLGCGLLLLGLFLLGAVAIAEQIGVPYVQGWPYLLLGTLGVFLLLQLLMLVFRTPESRADGDDRSGPGTHLPG